VSVANVLRVLIRPRYRESRRLEGITCPVE
jgi:hypothetical protein